MYNSYHFNNKERNNEKKYIYIFLTDLLNHCLAILYNP